eukprot:652597-Pleurochrysis_carterae.AAC.1
MDDALRPVEVGLLELHVEGDVLGREHGEGDVVSATEVGAAAVRKVEMWVLAGDWRVARGAAVEAGDVEQGLVVAVASSVHTREGTNVVRLAIEALLGLLRLTDDLLAVTGLARAER